jgi:hypothetical protein
VSHLTVIEDLREGDEEGSRLTGRNGTGGLSNSGKTAVDMGVINLKYGVSHIDTAQVSLHMSFMDYRQWLTGRDTVPRRRPVKPSMPLELRGILSGSLPRVCCSYDIQNNS